MSEMISFGAGVNSVAMTIMLVEDGWHGPIVFADTGGEHPETYCYMQYFERDFLKPYGLSITRLAFGSEYHKRSNLSLEQFCLKQSIVPYLMTRWCSVEWKANPLTRWKNERNIAIRLIGFTIDESHRMKYYPGAEFPLIDAGVNREECRRIIQRNHLELPVKSGCFFCPGQPLAAWKRLYFDYPDLFWRAVKMEENASQMRGKKITLDPDGISLRQHIERGWRGQLQMDLSEWLPCACRL